MSESKTPDGGPIELPLDIEPGPAHYITRAKSDALILRALDEAGFGATGTTEATGLEAAVAQPPLPIAPPRSRRRFAGGWLAAAILILCATVGSASAAVLWYARVRGTAPVTTTTIPRGERVESSRRASAPRWEPAPEALDTPSQLLPSTPPPPPAPVPTKAGRRAPEDWLVEGNRLRAEKRWASADDAYGRAFRGDPEGHSAYVARVASAAVRLEHLHDARGALARYRTALRQRPSGPLTEEIHYGIADAQRALGDREAERAALELFLREHPGSALAAQARARLGR